MALIVQKFGGVTLDSTPKLLRIAAHLAKQKKRGEDIVVVVSAMGKTTDRLLEQAHALCANPALSEIDMLLNTGEMVSASLLSIALNGIGTPATALCGYQAGIQTDQMFSNAAIVEIDTRRVSAELTEGRIVIVAGFQGQSRDGALTTLGRGGSDTTALALAARLGASRCEILKELPAVFSADPRLVPEARALTNLSYRQALDMTFWGAKVLQYRSVEIAEHFQVPLYVGPADGPQPGTLINGDPMLEEPEILSLNSHETVLQLNLVARSLNEAVKLLRRDLQRHEILFPQILHSKLTGRSVELFVTGPSEVLEALQTISQPQKTCSITATCRGLLNGKLIEDVLELLEKHSIPIRNMLVGAMSLTLFIEQSQRSSALAFLHQLVHQGDHASESAGNEIGLTEAALG